MGWTKMSKCWEYRPIASLWKLLVVLRHHFPLALHAVPTWMTPTNSRTILWEFWAVVIFCYSHGGLFPYNSIFSFCPWFHFFSTPFIFMLQCLVGIEPLKVRHNATKLDLTVHLLSFWCIGIDLNIQPMSLTLYMIGCIWSSIKNTSHRFFVSR